MNEMNRMNRARDHRGYAVCGGGDGEVSHETDDLSLLFMYSVNDVEGTCAPAIHKLRLSCCYRYCCF